MGMTGPCKPADDVDAVCIVSHANFCWGGRVVGSKEYAAFDLFQSFDPNVACNIGDRVDLSPVPRHTALSAHDAGGVQSVG